MTDHQTACKLAAEFLTAQGLRILDRDWHSRRPSLGQLHIVARTPDGITIFVLLHDGTSADASAQEQQRIRRLALLWLDENPCPALRLRFDVVTVSQPPDTATEVTHRPGCF